jgi:hypothetical protein
MKVEPTDYASTVPGVHAETPVHQVTKNVISHNQNQALVYPAAGPAVIIHIDPALFRTLDRSQQ